MGTAASLPKNSRLHVGSAVAITFCASTANHSKVALEDPALMHVFDALEISADDAWNLFTQLDSELWLQLWD